MRNHDFALMHTENGGRRSSHAHQPLASAPICQGADACAAADADSAVLYHQSQECAFGAFGAVTQSLVIAGKINFIENKDKVKILNKV